MLALCLMSLATYYAQNYAGIIGWSLMSSNHHVDAVIPCITIYIAMYVIDDYLKNCIEHA